MERDKLLVNDPLVERFLKYVAIDSTSDPHIKEVPSTKGQWDMILLVREQLESLGIADIKVYEPGYLIAKIGASESAGSKGADMPAIGFMAHVDTSSDVSGKNVKAVFHRNYDGSVIKYDNGLVLDPEEFPELKNHVEHTIITSDGTTLLGADNKAGVAIAVAVIEKLVKNPGIVHGPLEFIFTTEEETGRAMNSFDKNDLESVCCYTIDGDTMGSLEEECFNAFRADIDFTGQVIHLGTARGKLANAVTIAGKFISMLPQNESPEATDNRYGFYCPMEVSGNLNSAKLTLFLRDFDIAEIDRRIEVLKTQALLLERMYPGSKIEVAVQKQYLNMKTHIDRNPLVVELLIEAIRRAGIEPKLKLIRGGTDGARLSEMGIPTPNIFTGGQNFHSRLEWVSVDAMHKSVETIISLIGLWAEQEK